MLVSAWRTVMEIADRALNLLAGTLGRQQTRRPRHCDRNDLMGGNDDCDCKGAAGSVLALPILHLNVLLPTSSF